MKKFKLILLSLTSVFLCLQSQDQFPNTMLFNEDKGSPQATIEDIAWLAGHWQGEALGGIVEEIWAPPSGGSMMGAFKLVVNEKTVFYEIETIRELEETLILQLKHFGPDLKGWEEKDQTIDFKLVMVTPEKLFFDGFTIEKVDDNEINMYVLISSDGKKTETLFNYKRIK